MKRLTAVSFLLIFLLFLLTGCDKPVTGQKGTAGGAAGAQGINAAPAAVSGLDTADPVKLVMYLITDPYPDQALVYDEVNKKLKKDINATVEVKYLGWADYRQNYSLVFASGEDFDLIYTADWCFYADQAVRNAFKELDPGMIKKSAPDYYAMVPADSWDSVKIDGKIYMLPYLNKQVVGHYMAMIRGDLREKYGLPAIKTADDLDNYLLTIAKNEKSLKGYDGLINNLIDAMNYLYYKEPNNLYMFNMIPKVFAVRLDDPAGKVMYTLDDPAYLKMLMHSKMLADAGVWPASILSSKLDNYENFKEGRTVFKAGHSEDAIQFCSDILTMHPEWKPEVIDIWPDRIHESSSAARSGMAFNANSKNVGRALMMLNLFGTHKDYYDLTTYGIAGRHYEPIGDKKMKQLPEGALNFPAKSNCPWGWERKDFMLYPDIVPDNIINLESDWIKSGVVSDNPIVSFNFLNFNVENELAACDDIFKIRGWALLAGQLDDPAAQLAELKADLKKAGIEKIQAELQKQVTKYLNSLK